MTNGRMSVPVDVTGDKWAVLLNDNHNKERQRVKFLKNIGIFYLDIS